MVDIEPHSKDTAYVQEVVADRARLAAVQVEVEGSDTAVEVDWDPV